MKRSIARTAKQNSELSDAINLSGELAEHDLTCVSGGGKSLSSGTLFEVQDYSFDIEQVLTISSH